MSLLLFTRLGQEFVPTLDEHEMPPDIVVMAAITEVIVEEASDELVD